MMRTTIRGAGLGLASVLSATFPLQSAFAGDFDASGRYVQAADAVDFESFAMPERFVPADAETKCLGEGYELIVDPTALEGDDYARVKVKTDCAERFVLEVPSTPGRYRATVWIRHGSAGARVTVSYPDGSGRPLEAARFAPTGRATSDGWIELATNPLAIDGSLAPNVYLRFVDFASDEGVEVDALELVPEGEYRAPTACSGVRDPVCGSDAICIGGACVEGGPNVPPLPSDALRDGVVDALRGRIETFYGGRKTRLVDLPVARATLERMRTATSAWAFWNGYAQAVHELHDWHTNVRGAIQETGVRGRLNVCFVEGDADLSREVLPSDDVYRDVLVSHVGTAGTAGLRPGDRLVAVDGLHPIAWARGLADVDWSYHVASDSESFADFAEALGGPSWQGALLLRYARELAVIRCDAQTKTCSDVVETIRVDELPSAGGGADVACDNRPSYHLGPNSPDANTHYVFYDFFGGRIEGTTEDEAIYGLVWDTLYGGGDPNGFVNGKLRAGINQWKAEARGVILDHRAGNGGTLDAPELLTELVRPEEIFAVVRMPIAIAGYEGPADEAEGKQLFELAKSVTPYTVGSPEYAAELPVALLLHRDGSASDYLPLGMKGAPRTKLFGPGPTAGAFSTFIQFAYWGGLNFQLASGDTITKDGVAQIGRGVRPDFVVQQRQSDLMDGLDSIHEAALAWIREEQAP